LIIWAYYKKQLLDFKSSNKRRKLGKALRFFKKSHLYSKAEQTAHEFASKKKYFDSAELILEGLASEYGTDLRKIGMKSLAKEENLWHSGSEDYVFNQSILSIFSEITAELSEETQLNTVVKKVAYQANQVEITDSNQQKYLAKKVIVTVPLSVLKANLIEFTPNLPPAKLEAIQRIGFDIGMKVVLQFKSSFWSEEMTYLLGGENCPIYEVLAMGRETEKPVLCAYLMGRFANKLGELPETKVVETLLAELDKLFPQLETKPSELLEKSFQMDWGKEPHIWGAYSFASPHSEGMREVLAEPIQQTIYFSGEATHFDGHAATVHGAMEMSEWVVERIMEEEKEK
jgi:monoamine oxidase